MKTMPIGRHRGEEITSLPTQYLTWLVTQDDIRYRHWPLVKAICAVLRIRFTDTETLEAELRVKAPPPERWRSAKHAAQGRAERAEKLRELERRRGRRAEDLARRFAERRRRQEESPQGPDDITDLL